MDEAPERLEKELQKAIDKVGNSAAAVRKELAVSTEGVWYARDLWSERPTLSIADCIEQLLGSEGLLQERLALTGMWFTVMPEMMMIVHL